MIQEFPVSKIHVSTQEIHIHFQRFVFGAINGGKIALAIIDSWLTCLVGSMILDLILPESQFSSNNDRFRTGKEHNAKCPHELKNGEGGQETKPEPQEHVYLLINDIDGQDTLKIIEIGYIWRQTG